MNINSKKIGLSVIEAGWLLQRPEGQVRGMLRGGELTYVVDGRKIDPESVRRHLDRDIPRLFLDLVLEGKVAIPRPERRYGPPLPIYPGLIEFALMTGYCACDEESRHVMHALARELGPALILPPSTTEAVERPVH